jgi:hypothetical protein
MKISRMYLPALAVMLGAGGAMASSVYARLAPVNAHYQNGIDCNSTELTIEDNCSTSNAGTQCRVNVAGTPAAWNTAAGSSCDQALRTP